MTVFISYNHKDSDFVDRLALELVRNNLKVWKDKWKINVGDSVIDEIESGINGASFLIIVLSKNSIQSRWVKRELNAALIREIDDNNIRILPIIIDDCKIPLFLREKLYADFRKDFNEGFNHILSVVGKKYNIHGGGRVDAGTTYYLDYSFDQGFSDHCFFMNLDIVSFDTEEQFSILTQFWFSSNELPNDVFLDKALETEIKFRIIKICGHEFFLKPSRLKISPGAIVEGRFTIDDIQIPTHFDVKYRVNRLGVDSSGTVVFNIGALFCQICDSLQIEYK